MLVVREVLPGASRDSSSALHVVSGPKRRHERAVSIPLVESDPQKDRGHGVL